MRRIVWVAVGAVGGILAYRRAQQAMVDAKERGVVLSAQQVGTSAASAVSNARSIASQTTSLLGQTTSLWGQATESTPGTAAARVLARSRSTTTSTKESTSGVR